MGGFWQRWGFNAVGLSPIQLLAGIGVLFLNGRSPVAWLLTGAGALIIVLGIVANLRICFRPTSRFDTRIMLGLLAGGGGLVARSLRPPQARGPPGLPAASLAPILRRPIVTAAMMAPR